MVQKNNLGQKRILRAAGDFVGQGREWDRKNGTLPIGREEEREKKISWAEGQEQASSVQGPSIYLTIWNHGFIAFWSREKDSYLKAPV